MSFSRPTIPRLSGHGFTFTIGRGNEICVAAIEAFRPFVEGRSLQEIIADMGAFWRQLAGDSQLRWLGPEKGVVHLALAAVINAIWDLWGKAAGKPVWQLVTDLTPEAIRRTHRLPAYKDALRARRPWRSCSASTRRRLDALRS